jgi:hypothetical protein
MKLCNYEELTEQIVLRGKKRGRERLTFKDTGLLNIQLQLIHKRKLIWKLDVDLGKLLAMLKKINEYVAWLTSKKGTNLPSCSSRIAWPQRLRTVPGLHHP